MLRGGADPASARRAGAAGGRRGARGGRRPHAVDGARELLAAVERKKILEGSAGALGEPAQLLHGLRDVVGGRRQVGARPVDRLGETEAGQHREALLVGV